MEQRESEFNFCVMMAVAAAAPSGNLRSLTSHPKEKDLEDGTTMEGGREGKEEGRKEISLKFATTKSFALPPSLPSTHPSIRRSPPSSFVVCSTSSSSLPSLLGASFPLPTNSGPKSGRAFYISRSKPGRGVSRFSSSGMRKVTKDNRGAENRYMSEVEEAGADGDRRARSLTHLPPSLLPFARGPGAGAALLVYPPSFSPPSVRPTDDDLPFSLPPAAPVN